ncbi:methyl-accepting chemotaxis protein [Paenibacillus sp. UNC451MF]|uniref:methyl-accepting chemotaxis protein n=1 Tax=Paenibacillus sp. UNC451MF TaxID=1449063 RepID=UPI00069043A3|nr:methyl-accepting chemotaxis protein [Paenibacillus sp. UNC451MF]
MRTQTKKLPTMFDLSLKMKLVLGMTAMLALFLIAALYNLQQVDKMKAHLSQQNDKVELKLMALELKEMVQELNIIASGLEISKKADYIPKYNEKRTIFDGMIKKIGETATTPEQAKWRSKLISLTVEYTNTFDVAAKLVQDNKLPSADLDKNMEYLYNESQKLMADIFINVDQFYISYSEDAAQAIADTQTLLDRTVMAMWIASILVVISGVAIAYLLIGSFVKPIRKLQQAVQAMARGDLRARINSSSRDELGDLSRSFDHMIDQVRSMLSNMQSIASALSEHSSSFHSFSSSTAIANADIIRAIQEISSGADQQAGQTERSTYLIAEVEHEIEKIAENSITIQQKSREAAFNTHLGSTSMETLKHASKTSEEVLNKVFAAMESLSGSTVQIHQIVNTITDISHQTNVLALNAAIEAARAGVHGRGFSVIAEEVRQLSAQTNESSKSIAIIIRSLLEQTKELESYLNVARQSVDQQNSKMIESIDAFQHIRVSMDILSEHIDHIQEQIGAAKEMNGKLVDSVQFVAAIAQETAAGVVEVNSTSVQQDSAIQLIASQADDILELSSKLFHEINQFQIAEGTGQDLENSHYTAAEPKGEAALSDVMKPNSAVENEGTTVEQKSEDEVNHKKEEEKKLVTV